MTDTITPVWHGSTDSLTHTFEADTDQTDAAIRFALTKDDEEPKLWQAGTVDSSTEVSGRWVVVARTPAYEWFDLDPGWYWLWRDLDGSHDVVETIVVLG